MNVINDVEHYKKNIKLFKNSTLKGRQVRKKFEIYKSCNCSLSVFSKQFWINLSISKTFFLNYYLKKIYISLTSTYGLKIPKYW